MNFFLRNRWILTPFFLDEFSPELESIMQTGWKINRPSLPEGSIQRRMSLLHKPVKDFVANALKLKERPISVAGDCCAAIGMLAGIQQAGFDPVVLWLDAHGDFNTWETTPSGFLGGMPLAMIAGRGEKSMVDAVGLRPIPEPRIILTDGRNLDPGERQALERSEVVHVEDCLSLLEYLPTKEPLFIHLDPDILNPEVAPAMSYPAKGGPSLKELHELLGSIAQTSRIIAISMSTWNPKLDINGQSQAACMALLKTLVGRG